MSWIEDPGVEMFRGLNLSNLYIDQAYVVSNITYLGSLFLYILTDECYKCPYYRESTTLNFEPYGVVSTRYNQRWRILKDNVGSTSPISSWESITCEFDAPIGEFGVYYLEINDVAECKFETLKEPVNIYLPIIPNILIWVGIGIVFRLLLYLYNRCFSKKGSKEKGSLDGKKKRVKSIDAFRGLSLVIMILVNYGGGLYKFLDHSVWNGLTLADVVFPWFMWIMGTCIPISLKSQLGRGVPKLKIFKNILKRSIILFALGLILNTIYSAALEKLRIFGVLQRFGICYFVVASLGLIFFRGSYIEETGKWKRRLQDFRVLFLPWIIVLALLVLHTVLIFCLEVPYCPTGYLGPGGIQDNGAFGHCIGGATGYIDRQVLTVNHIYQSANTATPVYHSPNFDPEGILGCLTSIVQVFIGVHAGFIILLYKSHKDRLARWVIWGLLLGLVGGLLCMFSKEDGVIPVNKNLWSLSFVLVTSCFAFFVLAIFYLVIDVYGWWTGKPLLFVGMNSTIMYVGHELGYQIIPFHWSIGLMNTHFIYLFEGIWGVAMWMLVAYWLYRVKFFLSV